MRERPASKQEASERRLRELYAKIESENKLPDLLQLGIDNPAAALVWCIDAGRYPPPEILLTLRDAWWEYIFAAGSQSLEDAFIGPAKRKGGNFARRSSEGYKCLHLAILLAGTRRNHPSLSQMAAAELCVAEHQLNIDPETLVREVRKHNYLKSATSIVSEREGSADVAEHAKVARRFLMALKGKNKRRIIPVKVRR